MLKTYNILSVLVAIFLATISSGFAQENNITSSPYSRYGLGTLSNYSFGRTEAMGGIGIGTRYGYQINSANPASYTAIDSMTFLLEFGINSRHTRYEMESGSSASNDANFNYLAISVPIKHWWASAITLTPYSNIGYKIESTREIIHNEDTTGVLLSHSGDGTLTKIMWGNSFDITKNLSIGINSWFLFGKLNNSAFRAINQVNAFDLSENESLSINDFGFTFGLQYQFKTPKNNQWTFGAVFEPSKDFSSSYTLFREATLSQGGSIVIRDTLNDDRIDDKITLPLSYGAGFSYEIKDKLTLGADYYYQRWSKTAIHGTDPESLKNRSRYSAGLEYVPNMIHLKSYFKRMYYRVGLFYENSYLYLNGKQINSKGFTFGIGLPLKRSKTSLNLSAEIGKTGTTSNNLIEESYAKFTLQLLLHDRWFLKRKIE